MRSVGTGIHACNSPAILLRFRGILSFSVLVYSFSITADSSSWIRVQASIRNGSHSAEHTKIVIRSLFRASFDIDSSFPAISSYLGDKEPRSTHSASTGPSSVSFIQTSRPPHLEGTTLYRATARWLNGIDVEVVRLLLEHGADVHARNVCRKSASESAHGSGMQEVVN